VQTAKNGKGNTFSLAFEEGSGCCFSCLCLLIVHRLRVCCLLSFTGHELGRVQIPHIAILASRRTPGSLNGCLEKLLFMVFWFSWLCSEGLLQLFKQIAVKRA